MILGYMLINNRNWKKEKKSYLHNLELRNISRSVKKEEEEAGREGEKGDRINKKQVYKNDTWR